ncbi:MAG: DUF3160 domain-containing protein [Candidatus Eisenbacteria bacterium]
MASLHLRQLPVTMVALVMTLLLGGAVTAGTAEQAGLPDWAEGVLGDRGFVVVPGSFRGFVETYDALSEAGYPCYVTADAVLYSTAELLDRTLGALQEGDVYERLEGLSREMMRLSEEQYLLAQDPFVREAARLNMAYFAVGLSLLDGDHFPPESVRSLVERELALIEEGTATAMSPILGSTPLDYVAGPGEDYSYYCPRGRCASGERLSRFHRAATWYGRMAFALPEGRVADYELTRQALLLVRAIHGESGEWLELWERVQEPMAFFYGDSGDPTVVDYAEIADDVFGEGFDIELLADEDLLLEFAGRVSETAPTHFATHELRGMRFLVRKFPPDVPYLYALSLSDLRSLPTTLDVMALLDSRSARSILADDRRAFDSEVYRKTFERIEYELDALTYGDWTRDLHWSWMYALRPLLSAPSGGAPGHARGGAWDAKQLSTVAAAWALMRNTWDQSELREPGVRSMLVETRCLVDPYPELYARLSELIDHTSDRLLEHYLLTDEIDDALDAQRAVLARLEAAARAQLRGDRPASAGSAPAADESSLAQSVLGRSRTGPPLSFSATAYEDPVSNAVLEVAVGRPDVLYVRSPEGTVFAGAVFSFYEFERADVGNARGPGWGTSSVEDEDRPDWTSRFLVK